jgi:hypothetical protein
MIKRLSAGALALALLAGGFTTAPAVAAPVPTPSLAELKAYEDATEASGLGPRLRAESERAAELLRSRPGQRPTKGYPAQGGAGGSAARALAPCAAPCYQYNGFAQTFTADPATSVSIVTTVAKPYVDNATWPCTHSLGEVAAQKSANGTLDIVEIGWTVDKCRRADGNPTLFASHWINGVWKGMDVAFVDYAPNPVNLGAGLPKPVNKHFGINQTTTAWWVYYDSQPVAYVPKSRWTPGGVVRPFNAAVADIEVAQEFNETSGDETTPCTDMGTGTMYDATGTPTPPVTTWDSYTVGGTVTAANLTTFLGNPGTPGVWGAAQDTATSGRTGGPGYDASGTAPGTTNAC